MPYAVAALIIGFGIGWFARGWRAVLVVAAICLIFSVVGVVFGWFADDDMPALGGAIIVWMFFFGPLVLGVAVGVSRHRPVPAPLQFRGIPRLPPPDRPAATPDDPDL